jgi:spoIIIJ-associated protein
VCAQHQFARNSTVVTAVAVGQKSKGQSEGGQKAPKSGQKNEKSGQQASSQKPTVRENQAARPAEEHEMDAHMVGEEAQRFLEGLVTAFGLTGTVELVEDGDELELRVQGQELGLLVGPRGTTLQAVQDVVRVASQRRLGDHETRLRVDVGGYRERRRVALGQFATKMAEEVKESGVARVLEPMSSADRKIVHDTLADFEGIATRSEGDDPQRRVVIAPAND